MRELSLRAVILGVVVGALLAAANAFVGLKVGMTISASIPAAVVALLVLRKLLKNGTLLESNMVQTVGSAGASAVAGMIFTLPALFILGDRPEYLSMVIWAGIGGLLGVCFMIPLRQVLIVKEHGVLPFPEGVACAEVLESGQRGGAGARSVFWGALVGGAYYLFELLGIWNETGRLALRRFRTEVQLDSSPALLGVGYILGVRVAGYMLAGALLSWFILIPAVGYFGTTAQQPVPPETARLIADMSPKDVYEKYIRYVGAGAVAVGGLISLIRSFGTIGASLGHVLAGMFSFGRGPRPRTEKDLPFPLLVLIVAGLGYAMWHFEQVELNPVGVVAVLVFSFFFVTVSSRLVGIVGCSSNPISGMTIATLLATALVYKFFVMDRTGEMTDAEATALKITCLSVGAIVCVAIAIAGDTSQDLKTGFLVKATPYKQQVGEMIGVLTSVVAMAGLILLLDRTSGFVETPEHPRPLPAYQANIMKLLVDGVLGGQVPWTLILIGGTAAVVVELLGLPVLPFAVGMYLPLGLSTPIMVGGLIRWLVTRRRNTQTDHDPGVLTSSGLVAGQGLIGVALAGVTALISWWWASPYWTNPLEDKLEPVSPVHLAPWLMARIEAIPLRWGLSEDWWNALPMLPFVPLVIWLWWCARRRPPLSVPPDETDASDLPEPPTPQPRQPAAPTDRDTPAPVGGAVSPPPPTTGARIEPPSEPILEGRPQQAGPSDAEADDEGVRPDSGPSAIKVSPERLWPSGRVERALEEGTPSGGTEPEPSDAFRPLGPPPPLPKGDLGDACSTSNRGDAAEGDDDPYAQPVDDDSPQRGEVDRPGGTGRSLDQDRPDSGG